MNEKSEFTVQLKPRQIEYLKSIADKHGLADEHKALRCLIDFACETPEQEQTIFREVRCLDC